MIVVYITVLFRSSTRAIFSCAIYRILASNVTKPVSEVVKSLKLIANLTLTKEHRFKLIKFELKSEIS